MAKRVPRYGRAWSARCGRELCSSFLSREGRSSVEVEGSSLMLLSRPPVVEVWELMALRLSRWYGVPELSSSARVGRQEDNLESDVCRRKTMSSRFIMGGYKNKGREQM